MKLYCPSCTEHYHNTTAKFNPRVPCNGTMLELDPIWKERGWSSFPQDDSQGYGALECPGCGVPYPDSMGFVNHAIRELRGIEDFSILSMPIAGAYVMGKMQPVSFIHSVKAESGLKCSKCGKVYQYKMHLVTHEKKCEGI